jgi:hypothetical protein
MFDSNATHKQVSFLQTLLAERVIPAQVAKWLDSNVGDLGLGLYLTREDASRLIESLLASPRKSAEAGKPAKAFVAEVGMYRTEAGEIFKVQASRESGNLYAKRLTPNGFEYEQGAIRKLSADDKMTIEQAKAFGVATGVCCVCARELTDQQSVEAGIGPVCAKRWF